MSEPTEDTEAGHDQAAIDRAAVRLLRAANERLHALAALLDPLTALLTPADGGESWRDDGEADAARGEALRLLAAVRADAERTLAAPLR